MFFGSAAGGEVAATMYTLIASAARHQLDLWAYVDDVLRRWASGQPDLAELLPDRWEKIHPESIRTYQKDEQEARQAKPSQEKKSTGPVKKSGRETLVVPDAYLRSTSQQKHHSNPPA